MPPPDIYCTKPAAAPAKGYDIKAGARKEVWRLQIPIGSVKTIALNGLAKASNVKLESNDPKIVANDKITCIKQGTFWLATLPASQEGFTLITVGYDLPGSPSVEKNNGPVILQVQVTSATSTPAFYALPPEGQMDETSCWAACFSWFTKILPGVKTQTQVDIIGSSTGMTGEDGGITSDGFMLTPINGVNMRRVKINPGELESYLTPSRLPLIIAFQHPNGFGHANVLYGFDAKAKTVQVMEPWYPNPPIRFTGQNTTRKLSYYTSRPLSGKLLLAFRASP
jgi:hypothetical protein